MPVFKYFDENGKLITERRETLNASNIDRYIAEHGAEKAAVYLEAVQDMFLDLEAMLFPGTRRADWRRCKDIELYQVVSMELFVHDSAKKLLEPFADEGFLDGIELELARSREYNRRLTQHLNSD